MRKVRVLAVPVVTEPTYSAGTPGQRFLMVQEAQRPPALVSQMVLVQKWVEELKRLAPTK